MKETLEEAAINTVLLKFESECNDTRRNREIFHMEKLNLTNLRKACVEEADVQRKRDALRRRGEHGAGF